MPDLCQLADVKAWAGLTGTADDALLARLITAQSAFIVSYLGRPVLAQPVTETRDGEGGWRLPFAVTPVSAVSAVIIDGQSVPQAADTVQPGWRFTPTRLILQGQRFTKGRANVVIRYTGGFAQTPADIAQAAIELVVWRYRQRDRLGLTSRNLGGESASFSPKDLPDSVAALLAPYRQILPLAPVEVG